MMVAPLLVEMGTEEQRQQWLGLLTDLKFGANSSLSQMRAQTLQVLEPLPSVTAMCGGEWSKVWTSGGHTQVGHPCCAN